jgi:hypothetical protein
MNSNDDTELKNNYSGQVHQILYKTPESNIALSKMNEFLKSHLDY